MLERLIDLSVETMTNGGTADDLEAHMKELLADESIDQTKIKAALVRAWEQGLDTFPG